MGSPAKKLPQPPLGGLIVADTLKALVYKREYYLQMMQKAQQLNVHIFLVEITVMQIRQKLKIQHLNQISDLILHEQLPNHFWMIPLSIILMQ